MTSKNDFTVGDLVAVFGGDIGKDGKSANIVSLCNVVAVGMKDLIVEEKNPASYANTKSLYTVSQKICTKLFLEPNVLRSGEVTKPELGDLVTSYVRERYKDKDDRNITGILYKISYRLGKPDTATLMCGKEMCDVPFNSLMVLHTNLKD